MRLRATIISLLLVVAGCGVGPGQIDSEMVTTTVPKTTTVSQEPVTTRSETRPVWDGYASADIVSEGLTAITRGPLDVYESPRSAAPLMTLEPTTILGTTTVLGVVTAPADGWVEVMLPIRPNGSTGWVRDEGLSYYVVDGQIVVDLSDRQLTYLVDGVEVLRTDIGVGSDYNQTPTGHFFVTDSVTLADPNSPWGPYAFGLSARSESITEFNGGDGIIGIHGTNNPGSIGDNISLGCIRVPNDMITALHEMVPIGTRVSINA